MASLKNHAPNAENNWIAIVVTNTLPFVSRARLQELLRASVHALEDDVIEDV